MQKIISKAEFIEFLSNDLCERFQGVFGQIFRVEAIVVSTDEKTCHVVRAEELDDYAYEFGQLGEPKAVSETFYYCDTAKDVHELLGTFMMKHVTDVAP